MIKEFAYAKINLALEVMELVDGYHKVNNLMVPINIYDELSFEVADRIYVVDDPFSDNLCVKAAKLFIDKYKIKSGVEITLNKNIPYEAGLAGGSSDAAATLRGLNKLFNINASDSELKELASKIGSDVPFFIESKAALCKNRGEVIEPLNIKMPNIDLLLIKPNTGLSTKEVYANYKYKGISKGNRINNIIKGLKDNDINLVKANIFNDLASVALNLNKELKDIYNILDNYDIKPYLSGSGPTIYLINPKESDEEIINKLFVGKMYVKKCNIF